MKINKQEKLLLYTLQWIDECINSKLLPKECLLFQGQMIKVNFNKRAVKKALKNFNPSDREVIMMFMAMVNGGFVDESACNNFIKNNYPSFLDIT